MGLRDDNYALCTDPAHNDLSRRHLGAESLGYTVKHTIELPSRLLGDRAARRVE